MSYEVTVVVSAAFALDKKPTEEEAQDLFLEWLASVPPSWITESAEVEIVKT